MRTIALRWEIYKTYCIHNSTRCQIATQREEHVPNLHSTGWHLAGISRQLWSSLGAAFPLRILATVTVLKIYNSTIANTMDFSSSNEIPMKSQKKKKNGDALRSWYMARRSVRKLNSGPVNVPVISYTHWLVSWGHGKY